MGLDLARKVGFTACRRFYRAHVKCQLIDALDMEEQIKHMARQRLVGANDTVPARQ
jgi:hypothetical protein